MPDAIPLGAKVAYRAWMALRLGWETWEAEAYRIVGRNTLELDGAAPVVTYLLQRWDGAAHASSRLLTGVVTGVEAGQLKLWEEEKNE